MIYVQKYLFGHGGSGGSGGRFVDTAAPDGSTVGCAVQVTHALLSLAGLPAPEQEALLGWLLRTLPFVSGGAAALAWRLVRACLPRLAPPALQQLRAETLPEALRVAGLALLPHAPPLPPPLASPPGRGAAPPSDARLRLARRRRRGQLPVGAARGAR